MKLLFSRQRHIGSLGIRLVTWSTWSHVDIIVGENKIISANARHGVSYDTLDYRLNNSSKAVIVDIPLPDEKSAELWGSSQIGKKYDWVGVAGLGFHREWDNEDKWWCSEFALGYAKHGGFIPFREKYLRRVTPEHLWMLNFPITEIK